MGRTRKMKKRKTKKRGGHYVYYNHNKPRRYPYQGRSLAVHPGDCVASVFYVLGFSNYEDSVYLAETFPEGLQPHDIIKILDLAYQPFTHHWEKISHYNELHDFPVGHATMAIFDFDEVAGHAVVIYRHTDGAMYINDPQQNNGLVSGQVHDYFGTIYSFTRLGMGPDGTMHGISILRSNVPVHLSTDNRVHKGVIDYHKSDPNGTIVPLPPRGMELYPDEQEEARLQATYNMGAAAEHWGEQENSSLFGR